LGTIPYGEAFALQKREVDRIQEGEGGEVLMLLEHPHVFTIGRNADGRAIVADRSLIEQRGVTVAETDRGGDVTYHGPGQLVGYPLIELEQERRDIRRYVHDLEETLIRTLAEFDIEGGRHPEHRGVWISDRKIASVGVRVSRWITCHGFALNVATDLSYFSLMNPCGIVGCEMTSMERELHGTVEMNDVKRSIVRQFGNVYQREMEFDSLETAGRTSDAG